MNGCHSQPGARVTAVLLALLAGLGVAVFTGAGPQGGMSFAKAALITGLAAATGALAFAVGRLLGKR